MSDPNLVDVLAEYVALSDEVAEGLHGDDLVRFLRDEAQRTFAAILAAVPGSGGYYGVPTVPTVLMEAEARFLAAPVDPNNISAVEPQRVVDGGIWERRYYMAKALREAGLTEDGSDG